MTNNLKPFTLRENIWDNNTQVREVRKWQHTVAFRDTPEEKWRDSSLMHCNNCGECLSFNGKVCANCGLNFEEKADAGET